MRALVVGVICVLGLVACGGGQSGIASSSSTPSASPTATSSPTATAPPSTSAPTPAATPASTPSAPPVSTAAAALPACPGGGPSSGEPPASANGPTGACFAAEILFPAGGASCHPAGGGTYSGTTNCPLFPQLEQRLDQHPLSGPTGGADALCRCQNTYQSVSYGVAGPTADGPTTYNVRVTLTFGPASQEALDVIVQEVQSGSLVSDVQCGGRGPSTSIMQTPSAANNYLHC